MPSKRPRVGVPFDQSDGRPRAETPRSINRRDLLKLTVGGGVGLALGGLVDLSTVRAAAQELKLTSVSEFTTSRNFCSCGCGMIAAVSDGKLISMEGDYDHIVNRGSLCVKGISMFATHASPNRLMTPKYRAPGSDHWEEISWQDAVDRIATKIRKTRDATWIATDLVFQSVQKGGAMRDNNILTRYIKPAGRRLGLDFLNWRCLRTSHATWVKMAGADVKDAQAQMRHARASTTLDIYQQFTPESQRRAVDRLTSLTNMVQ